MVFIKITMNTRLTFHLKNGYRYEGTLISKDEKTFVIHDIRTDKKVTIFVDQIVSISEKSE